MRADLGKFLPVPILALAGILFVGCLSRDGKSGPPDILVPGDTLSKASIDSGAVLGLKLTYDTLNGVVLLSWHSTRIREFSQYLVYRDGSPSFSQTENPLLTTRDTFARDTIFRERNGEGKFGFSDTTGYLYEYRLRAKDEQGSIGPSANSEAVRAVSPTRVKTFIDLALLNARGDSASIGDTVRVLARFRNEKRENVLLEWRVDGESKPIRDMQLSGHAGEDILLVIRSAVGTVRIETAIRDQGGKVWERRIDLRLVTDAPIPDAGRDTLLEIGQNLRLIGRARNTFGSISKWEWDIGAQGDFREVTGGDTVVTMPGRPDSAFRCVLRVTDDDGNVAQDTIKVLISPWKRKTDRPYRLGKWGMQAAKWDSRIYVFGYAWPSQNSVYDYNAYNPGDDLWEEGPRNGRWISQEVVPLADGIYFINAAERGITVFHPDSNSWNHHTYSDGMNDKSGTTLESYQAMGSKLWIVAGSLADNAASTGWQFLVQEFNRPKNRLDSLPLLPLSGPDARFFSGGGKLFVSGGSQPQLHVLAVGSDIWHSLPMSGLPTEDSTGQIFESGVYLGESGGRLFLKTGGSRFLVFDSVTQTWSRGPDIPATGKISAHAAGGRIVILGESDGRADILIYDMLRDNWIRRWPILGLGSLVKHFLIGKNLYFLAVPQSTEPYPASPAVWEYPILED